MEFTIQNNQSPRAFVLVALAVLLLALNLRIPTAALGPLLPDLRTETGHGETFLSLLTTIPLALTLVVAPFAPRLADRFGRNRVIGCALVGIAAGTAVRSIPGDPTLLAGTALLGGAIAVGTVLGPAVIAAEHPTRRGALTGVYTMALSLGPALALGLTIPMMRGTGFNWRETLVLWALGSVIALIAWVGYTRSARSGSMSEPEANTNHAPPPRSGSRPPSVIVDPRVWILALYLGVTSLTFYTTSAWLPTAFIMDGMTAGAAGGYTSLLNIVALPFAFLAPAVMRRGCGHILAPLSPLVAAVGIVLLLTAGSAGALPVALLLGIAQGLCLGVSYDQIVQYSRSSVHAASVSALTSTVGIAIASLGPLAFGFGLETSGSYIIPVSALGAVILIQAAVGFRSGRFSQI